MPHKHKRKADSDDTHFNLPPTSSAAPLPVGTSRGRNPNPAANPRKKRKVANINGYGADDTPKAFARLMHMKSTGKAGRNGLDDGNPKPKKRKNTRKGSNTDPAPAEKNTDVVNSESQPQQKQQQQQQEVPKIRPGEKLSDFAQRVNQALPLIGLHKSTKKIAGVRDHRVTKHEKKLKRLQEGWRKEEARIRDKEAEERELAEEEVEENDALWEDKSADLPPNKPGKSQKKKAKRKRVAGEIDTKEEDPWDALQRSRPNKPKNLHDVVQAPPTFDRVPREIFKVKNGAKVVVGNVPTKAGSLRRREELESERGTIIETYRRLMGERRGEGKLG